MDPFNPSYELTDDISRLLREIESQEFHIFKNPNHRELLKKYWQQSKLDSIRSACLLQKKWKLQPDTALSALSGNLVMGASTTEVRRIQNYARILDGLSLWKPYKPYEISELKTLHRDLRAGVGGKGKYDSPGQIRSEVIAVYYNDGIKVKYFPPKPRELPELLEALFQWLNQAGQGEVNTFILTAICHHRLMELRPFLQDNGKTARLYLRKQLISTVCPWRKLLPFETIFTKDISLYYHYLDNFEIPSHEFSYRRGPKLTEWITYFLTGISDVLSDLLEQLSIEPTKKVVTRLLNERQKKALQYVKRHGEISNRVYRKLFDLERNWAYKELNDMVQKGFLTASASKGRSVKYYLLSIASD